MLKIDEFEESWADDELDGRNQENETTEFTIKKIQDFGNLEDTAELSEQMTESLRITEVCRYGVHLRVRGVNSSPILDEKSTREDGGIIDERYSQIF